jgi:hypothetical protein
MSCGSEITRQFNETPREDNALAWPNVEYDEQRCTTVWGTHARRARSPDEELIRVIRGWKLLFRRGRGAEFLKTRIIPKRIEHGIKPEQRRSKRYVLALRREIS